MSNRFMWLETESNCRQGLAKGGWLMKIKRCAVLCMFLFVGAAMLVGLTGCRSPEAAGKSESVSSQTLDPDSTAFAAYKEVPVTLDPSLEPYQVKPDFSNVINLEQFHLTPVAKNVMIQNGFVVVPRDDREFFSIYEGNRYMNVPNFITTDAMLHNYHLYFSYLLRNLEKKQLRGELAALTESMLSGSQDQYQELKDTAWENAAKRNVAFFAVGARLLDPQAEIPSFVSQEVNSELQLIAEHNKITSSPVMNLGNEDAGLEEALKEDYTQYIPRGHYTKSEDLKTYFQAMMWYGRLTFRASNEDETKSAALMTRLLSSKADFERWNRIYEPTNFFVGKSDDLGFTQYYQLMEKSFGGIPVLADLTGDEAKWKAFRAGTKTLEPPAINSMPIFDETIQPDREKEIKGFRFMGQRFTLDASVFQRLIYREVQENHEGEQRMLPKGLDLPAVMGSREAYSVLEGMGETGYQKYPENMQKMQVYISKLDTPTRTQNLYWSWLYTLEPLTEPKGEGYPSFMQGQAWTRKQLETYLGSWTELKHDTLLYAKQVYAEMGGGEEPWDDRGYVEANPVVFARLAALTRMTIDGLESRELLNEGDRASLERMEELNLKLKTIAEKELANKPLEDEEYELIRSFGGQLEHFWLEALKDEGVQSSSDVYENPAALVADVATDPNGQVLEEGTGFINTIYVVVPVDGKLRIASGGVYSYYEFPWPIDDRLTDQKWQEMLKNDEAPDRPSWTKTYTTEPPEW